MSHPLVPAVAENEFPGMPISALRNLIDRADQVYFHGGPRDAVIPDHLYDAAKAELRRRVPSDERLLRVGAPVPSDSMLEKVRHFHVMGSLNNALDLAAAVTWMRKVREIHAAARFHLSYKMDGGSVSLNYIDGYLMRAVTRGDGVTGEDITANMIQAEGVPRFVTNPDGLPFSGAVRGEVILPLATWRTLDPENTSNARNMGNGMMRRKAGDGAEMLRFYAFRLFDQGGRPIPISSTETAMSMRMAAMGFITAPYIGPSSLADEDQIGGVYTGMVEGLAGMPPSREQLAFEIDGLVIKVDLISQQLSLGESGQCPKGQIALKFPPPGAETVLREVEINLGRTGALIPVGIFDSVRLGGVNITRATLCNFEEIARLGIAIGDVVRVSRQAEVIPKIISKVRDGEPRTLIATPRKCPVTGGPVGHIDNADGTKSAHLYSLESHDSTPVKLACLRKWVTELDIQGLGDVYLQALYESKWMDSEDEPKPRLVETPADLYRLKPRGVRFLKRDGQMIIGPLSMARAVDNIEAKRTMDLTEFLGALGVHGLGKSKAAKIRAAMPGEFDTVEDWLSGKLVLNADTLKIPGTAKKYHEEFQRLKPLIMDLQTLLTITQQRTESGAGKLVFCLTGEFSKPKDFYHDMITRHGQLWAPRFTKAVTHVVSENPVSQSQKAQKARAAGIPVIGVEELMIILTEKRISTNDASS